MILLLLETVLFAYCLTLGTPVKVLLFSSIMVWFSCMIWNLVRSVAAIVAIHREYDTADGL